MENLKIKNLEFEGVDLSDYPDFCDAYVCYAEHKDGTPLTESELENIVASEYFDELYESII